MDGIDQKDLAILLALESNPLMSTKDLAKELKTSWPTTKKRFTEITNRGIIKNPLGIYNPEALGLRKISVIVNPIGYEGLIKFEKVIREHPYIHYRARLIGSLIGVFLQFDIPIEDIAKENLIIFIEKLVDLNVIRSFVFYESSAVRFEVYPQLSKFDLDTLSWNFSWKKWFDKLDSFPTSYDFKTTERENFENFTPLRFDILKTLSSNAGLKQAELMDMFNLSRTEAHRHYNYVKNTLIQEIRLNYNRDFFELTETYLIVIENNSNEEQGILYNAIKDAPPPFRFAIDILADGKTILWGNMSLNQINDFLLNLWKRFQDIQIFRLNTRDSGSAIYEFYPPNFDFEEMNWRIDRNYMVEEPLKFFEKS
ncbi:MAG: Lrp/AsnC family transcriptional regulator [Candidatus Kariarchaeaceae archaeon]